MVGLAFAVAASANFPVLLLSMFWRGLTTRGALAGGVIGMLSSVLLICLTKAVYVDTFHFGETAPIPYQNPAMFSIFISFFCCWFFSITDKSARAKEEQAAFDAQFVRSITGVGAEQGKDH